MFEIAVLSLVLWAPPWPAGDLGAWIQRAFLGMNPRPTSTADGDAETGSGPPTPPPLSKAPSPRGPGASSHDHDSVGQSVKDPSMHDLDGDQPTPAAEPPLPSGLDQPGGQAGGPPTAAPPPPNPKERDPLAQRLDQLEDRLRSIEREDLGRTRELRVDTARIEQAQSTLWRIEERQRQIYYAVAAVGGAIVLLACAALLALRRSRSATALHTTSAARPSPFERTPAVPRRPVEMTAAASTSASPQRDGSGAPFRQSSPEAPWAMTNRRESDSVSSKPPTAQRTPVVGKSAQEAATLRHLPASGKDPSAAATESATDVPTSEPPADGKATKTLVRAALLAMEDAIEAAVGRPSAVETTTWQTVVATHRGHVRTENQDFGIAVPLGHGASLVVVADGCGGHPRGWEASRVAVAAATRHILDTRQPHPDADLTPNEAEPLLRGAFAAAIEQVRLAARACDEHQGRGWHTTLLVVLTDPRRHHVAYMGDGGIVLVRAHDGSQHELLRPMRDPASGALLNTVNPRATPLHARIDSFEHQPGDVVFVGTDGVFDVIGRDEIKTILRDAVRRGGDVESALRARLAAYADFRIDGAYAFDDNMTLAVALPDGAPSFGRGFWMKQAC